MPKQCYRFSLGGTSGKGQVGLCFDFEVEQPKRNEKDAVKKVRKHLKLFGDDCGAIQVQGMIGGMTPDVVLYIEPKNITVNDIVM